MAKGLPEGPDAPSASSRRHEAGPQNEEEKVSHNSCNPHFLANPPNVRLIFCGIDH